MVARYYDRTQTVFAVDASITAQNQFTEPAEFDVARPFNLSVAGTFTGTVTLQRSFDGGTTWRDVWSTSQPAEEIVDTPEPDVLWRAGIKTGNFGTGSASIRLSQ